MPFREHWIQICDGLNREILQSSSLQSTQLCFDFPDQAGVGRHSWHIDPNINKKCWEFFNFTSEYLVAF